MKSPGYGPQILVYVSTCQGNPFWAYPIFDNHRTTAIWVCEVSNYPPSPEMIDSLLVSLRCMLSLLGRSKLNYLRFHLPGFHFGVTLFLTHSLVSHWYASICLRILLFFSLAGFKRNSSLLVVVFLAEVLTK